MEIKELLSQTDKLPNIPEVVRDLVQALNNPDANYGDIAEKVTKDQTISLKILRLVNSAHFGLSRKVASIDEAVVMLGMGKLKTLVIASGFANSASDVEGIDLPEFWSDAFQVATIARWLAERSGGSVEADLAFTSGIIHNIGQLLLHMAQPNRAMAIKTLLEQSDISRAQAESERLGFTTADAGEALLNLWKFPEELANAVRDQNAPQKSEDDAKLAATLFLACFIHDAAKRETGAEDVVAAFPSDIAKLAALDSDITDHLEEALALQSGMDSLAAE
ncbi:MAG: HDOD domain-containing protein [Pseudomonadales bacterium]